MSDAIVRPDTPLGYAQSACDTMMRRYAAADLPPKGHFHYHQGVFLSGVYKTYQLCGNEAYFSYMKDWIDSVFTEDGRIKNDYKHGDLDDIQPGILLFPLLEKTGDEKYRKCIEFVAAQLPDVPLCKCGGLYHKVSLTGQMWLDGLYMAGPFAAEYAHGNADQKTLQEQAEQWADIHAHHTAFQHRQANVVDPRIAADDAAGICHDLLGYIKYGHDDVKSV